MSTNRTTVRRTRQPHITPEVVDLFVRCEELWPIYYACISRPYVCRSDDESKHCPECLACINARRERDCLLGIEPWTPGLEQVDTAQPPPDLDRMHRKAWRRVWRLRCELEAEVAKREKVEA